MTRLYLDVHIYLTLLLVCWAFGGFAQQTVSGKVTALNDTSALPGVNILEKGTTQHTVSDAGGKYRINVGTSATLIFSFMGYVTRQVPVGSQASVDVNLQSDVTALSEVVVVGYGTQEKKEITGLHERQRWNTANDRNKRLCSRLRNWK